MKVQKERSAGFSMLEVCMTIAILAVTLPALMGLLPLCLTRSRSSVDETRATHLARMVFSTLESEPLHAAPCFGTAAAAPLNLGSAVESGTPVLLFASYMSPPPGENPMDAAPRLPWVRRSTDTIMEADYRIELRIHPEAERGSTVHLTVRTQPAGENVFTAVQFMSRVGGTRLDPASSTP